MLDVRRMKVLREVANRGSFSAAADALSFTQSAVSQQIAALEREAGVTLVERSARGIRLTDAGEVVVRHAEVVLARLAEAERELEALAGLRGGRLRMAAFESAGASLMPLAVAEFRRRHPAVELSLTLAEPEDALGSMRAGELDLALAMSSRTLGEPDIDGFEAVHLLDDPMLLALPLDHPLARKARIRLEDFAAEAWIHGTPGCDCNKMVIRACEGAGFSPRVAFESDDYGAMQGFVAAGVGVAIIAELGTSTVRDDIVLRSLHGQVPDRRIYAVAPSGGYRPAATDAMIDILQQVSRDYAASRGASLALVS
ncbi:MAG TPA: LysR family transcriptional regulator [Solirubrobacteraceae bacterium]|jgi:DNA-binding transcriptional LysR family regulator